MFVRVISWIVRQAPEYKTIHEITRSNTNCKATIMKLAGLTVNAISTFHNLRDWDAKTVKIEPEL